MTYRKMNRESWHTEWHAAYAKAQAAFANATKGTLVRERERGVHMASRMHLAAVNGHFAGVSDLLK